MPRLNVDLTKVDVIEGDFKDAEVKKVEYQIKTGEKWNNEGTSTVTKDQWENAADELARLHLTIAIPGKGSLFHDFYFSEKALPMTKRALTAIGVAFKAEGYNPDDAIGRKVGIVVAIKEEGGYEPRPNIVKFYKV